MHDYPIAQESINTENNNIPFAIRVLDWESLMSMIGLQFSVVCYMLSATLSRAKWIEFNGDVKKGFFFVFDGIFVNNNRDDDMDYKQKGKIIGGLIIAYAYLVISIPVVFTYWLVVKVVIAAAVKAIIETASIIGESVSACCSWIKKLSMNLAAKLHNKIFGQQQNQPDNSDTQIIKNTHTSGEILVPDNSNMKDTKNTKDTSLVLSFPYYIYRAMMHAPCRQKVTLVVTPPATLVLSRATVATIPPSKLLSF